MNETTKTLGMKLFQGAAGAGAGAATQIADIVSVDGLPDLVFDEYDSSRVDQTSLIKEFAMTLADGGSLKLKLASTEDKLTTLYALFDGEPRGWKIAFSNTAVLHFDGSLKRIGGEAGGTNTEVVLPVEVRVSSMPVYVEPA
jgi:hypothetical protein